MTSAVELVRIGKSFLGVAALAEVDLALRPGSIHALVGENGAGKSTLINILSGVLTPDLGELRIAGAAVRFTDARAAHRHGIVTVHQEVDLFPDLTVLENLGLEQGLPANRFGWIDWRTQQRRSREALAAIGEDLPLHALADTLSPAQRQLVLIAAAVSQAARVLILDEPTSSLSEAEAQVLFRHVRRFREEGTAVLYVSHRLEEIFALADEVTVLRDGRRAWTGPITDTAPDQLIGHMVGRTITAAATRTVKPQGPVRFRCKAITAADGSCRDITFDAHSGEILGLYGLVGAGRSEWAQTVFGLRTLAEGAMWIDGDSLITKEPHDAILRGLAYLPEDRLRHGLCRGLTVRANVVLASLRQLASRLWLSRRREVERTQTAIASLAIRANSPEQRAGTLSGGNQQKVVLARWLGTEPKVLILDEPTRGVDVGAKAEIYALIQRLVAEGRAIVFISSDLSEVLSQSDRVGVFREGRLVAFFDPRQASAEQIAAAAYPQATGTWRRLRAAATRAAASSRRYELPREAALLFIVLAFFGLLEARTGSFLHEGNLRNLATDASLLAFSAVGAALVIMAGGLDISLGALMALSAGVAGQLWERGAPLPLVVLVAVGLGGLGGLLNASLSLIGKVHPIVVTLGTMSVFRGLTLWWLGQDVDIPGEARNWLFDERFHLPLIVWAGLLLLMATWLWLRGTVAGRALVAYGGNPTAAHRLGIEQRRVWLRAFIVQGMLVGLAGLLSLCRSGSVQPSSFEEATLEAIAAVVVGGVAITGGRGSVWGVAIGCVLMVSLKPACTFLHISPYWESTLVGSVLAVAVVADALWRRRAA